MSMSSKCAEELWNRTNDPQIMLEIVKETAIFDVMIFLDMMATFQRATSDIRANVRPVWAGYNLVTSLKANGATPALLTFARHFALTLNDLWQQCPRLDWMLWLLDHMSVVRSRPWLDPTWLVDNEAARAAFKKHLTPEWRPL